MSVLQYFSISLTDAVHCSYLSGKVVDIPEKILVYRFKRRNAARLERVEILLSKRFAAFFLGNTAQRLCVYCAGRLANNTLR